MQFVADNGGLEKLHELEQDSIDTTYDQIANSINLEPEMEPVTADYIEHLADKYDLQESVVDSSRSSTVVLVKRNEITGKTANVWSFTFSFSNTQVKVTMVNIGSDPIDSIKGTLTVYGLNGDTYKILDQDSVSCVQANTGVIHTWNINRAAVKERLIYTLIVVEDGVQVRHTNVDESKEEIRFIRYYFDVGPYTSISALGGERHHFVSRACLESGGYNTNRAHAIRMTREDHKQTGSNSNALYVAEEKALLAAGKYSELLQKEVEDFQEKEDPDGFYPNLQQKYNEQIWPCLAYYETLFGIR